MHLYVYIWHIVHIYIYTYIYILYKYIYISILFKFRTLLGKKYLLNSWRSAWNLETRCFRPKVRMTMTTSPVVEEEWCLRKKNRGWKIPPTWDGTPNGPKTKLTPRKVTESFWWFWIDVETLAGVFLFGFWWITFGLLVDGCLASFGWFLRWDLLVVKFGIRKEDNWKRRILRRLQSGPLRWL